MKKIDLTKVLAPYTSGWLALDTNYRVVAHEKTFNKLNEKLKKQKTVENILTIPAAKDYFGFIT